MKREAAQLAYGEFKELASAYIAREKAEGRAPTRQGVADALGAAAVDFAGLGEYALTELRTVASRAFERIVETTDLKEG